MPLYGHAQGLTIDSMIPEGAHPRVVQGQEVLDIEQYYATHNPAHLRAANARVFPKPAAVMSEEEGSVEETGLGKEAGGDEL